MSPPPAALPAPSPLSISRAQLLDDTLDAVTIGDKIFQHAVDVHNFAKVHRCRRSYCLCKLRTGDSEYRECAKGGFGPEAPLVHHRVEGPMRPINAGTADGDAAC